VLTPGEIGATQAALDRIAAERDSLAAQAGIGARITSAFSSLFTGTDPADTLASAAASMAAYYDAARDLRNAAFESPEEEHEAALMIVDMANRVAGSASQVEQAADLSSASGAVRHTVEEAVDYVGQAARTAYDSALSASKWIVVGLAALAVVVVVVRFAPRR
jgi:hypothetical protein